jgi:TonB family protein
MADHHKKKQFLNLPKYIGGSESFRKFIAETLRYPEAALEAKIEGSVIVEYDISDDGLVYNPHVLKGLGYGCDEEAVRVIGLLRFEKVKNRGVRVKLTTKTTIHFKLPQTGFTISYSSSEKTEPEQKKDGPLTYEYTVTF